MRRANYQIDCEDGERQSVRTMDTHKLMYELDQLMTHEYMPYRNAETNETLWRLLRETRRRLERTRNG